MQLTNPVSSQVVSRFAGSQKSTAFLMVESSQRSNQLCPDSKHRQCLLRLSVTRKNPADGAMALSQVVIPQINEAIANNLVWRNDQ